MGRSQNQKQNQVEIELILHKERLAQQKLKQKLQIITQTLINKN
jgi:hypothetical protein